jgi:phospholipid/cholesterol/gamma-HCH transport system permease protein
MTSLFTNSVVAHFLHELGSVWLFYVRGIRTLFTTYGNVRPIFQQIVFVTYRSLSTVIFSGIFVGAILVLQFDLILQAYDAESLLGGLNTSTVVREVGPLIISFLLAGKIGAFTAAELGTMRVTEQIDAIECLGTDPMQYLVVPRLIGIIFSSIILMIIGLIVSIAGSMLVASALCEVNFLEFANSIPKFTSVWTLVGGLIKSTVYGTIVATVSCHKGFTASGGASGVGKAVTGAALYTNLYILIANFVTSHLLNFAHELIQILTGVNL